MLPIVFLFPFIWMILTSIKTYGETIVYPPTIFPAVPQWINFQKVWESGPYLMYLRNSVVVTLSVIALQTLVMLPAAYAFGRYKFRGRDFCFGIVMLAFMILGELTFISIYLMMANAGLLKSLWPQILPFGANAFGIFMLRQTFKQVPDELIESARLDNASEMSILFRIMLPMAKSSTVALTMFSFISHWNDYFWPFVMTNSISVRPLTIGIAALRDIEGSHQWEIIMAGNVILVLPIITVYLLFNKRIISAFTYPQYVRVHSPCASCQRLVSEFRRRQRQGCAERCDARPLIRQDEQ
ncbi:sugar ABC transporter permease [Clostridia bacterium]|nr:sugar ABC transporter permease [Clostridia bacterium]